MPDVADVESKDKIGCEAKKIAPLPKSEILDLGKRFSAGIQNLLCDYLVERKIMVMQNPASGQGELFALPESSSVLKDLDSLTSSFFSKIE